MTASTLRNKATKWIVLSNAFLYLTLIFLYLLGGKFGLGQPFKPNEFSTLIGFLTPVTAVYLGGILKFTLNNPYQEDVEKIEDKEITPMYVKLTKYFIPAHFVILATAVLLYALGGNLDFEALKNIFALVESFFGAYVGLIISTIFSQK